MTLSNDKIELHDAISTASNASTHRCQTDTAADTDIRRLLPDELEAILVDELGEKKFRSAQILRWIFEKRVQSWDEMTNLSKSLREKLANRFVLAPLPHPTEHLAKDGTNKIAFPLHDNSIVESVLIPTPDRLTLCVSSQVGCKFGCAFCRTATLGFYRHLSASEIVQQVLVAQNVAQNRLGRRITNIVYMGMGEPLDNYDSVMKAIAVLTSDWGFGWSPKRITVSTIGVLPNLKRYLDESRCHLAVSLHSPFHEERLSIMPVEKAWPIEDTVSLIRQYDFTGQRRVSFEYTMFAGFNDDKRHADAIARLLKGIECRVNLIRFHKIPDFPYETSSDAVMEAFRGRLEHAGIVSTVRASRGEDIMAACGMLAGKHNKRIAE